eukprot:scaffold370_cov289-Prasinococcus_capsulatus_cf.AAC.9
MAERRFSGQCVFLSTMVCRHLWLRMSQTLTTLSTDSEMSWLSSSFTITSCTEAEWPCSRPTERPVNGFHSRMCRSSPHEAIKLYERHTSKERTPRACCRTAHLGVFRSMSTSCSAESIELRPHARRQRARKRSASAGRRQPPACAARRAAPRRAPCEQGVRLAEVADLGDPVRVQLRRRQQLHARQPGPSPPRAPTPGTWARAPAPACSQRQRRAAREGAADGKAFRRAASKQASGRASERALRGCVPAAPACRAAARRRRRWSGPPRPPPAAAAPGARGP